ncbi:MAG: AarF/ABC1/UbiB kinase family protein, partial [bacterium]|nr:AarF/ABC1/UbiB kinase family protein [bacterium]
FFLAALFEKYISESRNYQPVKLVKEFASWAMRELDFTVEATNADHFRVNLKNYPLVKIPEIFWDYTAKRVLTMEFIDGVEVGDLDGLKKRKIDPQDLALLGLDIALKQVFIDGFFQADPHPGNFFALPGNVLCLHDFGMVGYLTPEMRSELVSIFISLNDKNAEGVLKHLIHLAEIDDDSELKLFRDSVFAILDRWFYGLGRRESAAAIFYRVVNAGAKYRVIFPPDLIYFGKALITAEAMGKKLWPDCDLDAVLRPFIARIISVQFDPQRIYSSLRSDFFDLTRFLKELPQSTKNLLEKLEKGDIGVRINPKEFLEIKQEIDRQNDLKILALITAATILAAAILLRIEKAPALFGLSLGYLGALISLLLIIWSIIKVRK